MLFCSDVIRKGWFLSLVLGTTGMALFYNASLRNVEQSHFHECVSSKRTWNSLAPRSDPCSWPVGAALGWGDYIACPDIKAGPGATEKRTIINTAGV